MTATRRTRHPLAGEFFYKEGADAPELAAAIVAHFGGDVDKAYQYTHRKPWQFNSGTKAREAWSILHLAVMKLQREHHAKASELRERKECRESRLQALASKYIDEAADTRDLRELAEEILTRLETMADDAGIVAYGQGDYAAMHKSYRDAQRYAKCKEIIRERY